MKIKLSTIGDRLPLTTLGVHPFISVSQQYTTIADAKNCITTLFSMLSMKEIIMHNTFVQAKQNSPALELLKRTKRHVSFGDIVLVYIHVIFLFSLLYVLVLWICVFFCLERVYFHVLFIEGRLSFPRELECLQTCSLVSHQDIGAGIPSF